MNALLGLAVYLVVVAAVGLVATDLATWRDARLRLPVSPLFGACALALQLWLYGLVKIPWLAPLVLGPWLLAAIFRARSIRSRLAAGISGVVALASKRRAAVLLVLAVLVLPELGALALRPVVGNDAVAIWMLRARVFLAHSAVNIDPVADAARHPEYPPLYSLLVDSVWVVTGTASDQVGKAVDAVFLLSLLGSVLTLFWRRLGLFLAAAGVMTIATMPGLDRFLYSGYYMGYADFALAALFAVAGMCVVAWLTDGHAADLALGIPFALVAALTKNEGLLFSVALGAVTLATWRAAHVSTRELRRLWPAFLLAVPVLGWRVFVALHGYGGPALATSTEVASGRAGALSQAVRVANFALHLMDLAHSDYAWVVLAGLAAAGLAVLSRDRAAIAVTVLVALQGLGYYLVYVSLPGDIDYWLNTSADRLTAHLLPLTLVALLTGLAATRPGAAPSPYPTPRGAEPRLAGS